MKAVSPNVSFPQLEERTLAYWRDKQIFAKSIDPCLPSPGANGQEKLRRKPYVFYDGPPFATGLPHYGHLLAGTIKDVIGRYFTMKGYHVDRRFGWDCHGMPVEFEIQKKLDLHGAKAIREFGVDRFNEECRKIVMRYTREWREFVERSGRWVDFNREYRTMDLEFMETIWWAAKSLWDRGLMYESLKCVPYSWAMNTALSNFEANLNYQDVQDPALTVRLPLVEKGLEPFRAQGLPQWPIVAYVWTTTPWTLPSNMALAVRRDIHYSFVLSPKDKEVVIVAAELVGEFFPELHKGNGSRKKNGHDSGQEGAEKSVDDAKTLPAVAFQVQGGALLGLEYEPLFPYFSGEREKKSFRFYHGDFVTADEGTGIVHCASFGEEDLGLFLENGITVVDPVDEDGRFLPEVADFAGMNVKEADPKIIQHLRRQGSLVSHKTIEHSYPFCWRTDTPLIYKSIPTWFVRVDAIKDLLLQGNSTIHWVPEHIRDGRFGKWLEGARDWAISRNRFWGTPIPVWVCEGCGDKVCLGSVTELAQRTGETVSDLHSHCIDHLTFACEKCRATMRRIPQVFDCWFESGSMPYAQEHYPFENKREFEQNFPADFIAEGLDQTRGWFYTLLVLGTALFGRSPFRNVIVNGIVLAEDGKKMSKSLKNYPPPDEVMNELGADAMRLYLLSSAATRAEDLRFSKNGVRQVIRQTMLPLWNAYNFFVTYALVDNWTPNRVVKKAPSNLLDRWILSKTASLIDGVDKALSSYHLALAVPPILEYVDQLTNWYIRLNRRRFWSGNTPAEQEDKMQAYAALHQALLAFVRVLAPLAPFISEEIFLNLKEGALDIDYESVHLAPFPSVQDFSGFAVDRSLEEAMDLFEEVILLGRSVRNDQGLKVRQPLAKITIVHPNENLLRQLRLLDEYIRDELNVKTIEYTSDEEKYVTLQARLNTQLLGKVLGPKLGRDGMKRLQEGVAALRTEDLRKIEDGDLLSVEGVEMNEDTLLISRAVKPGVKAAASSGQITIQLDTALTQELKLEGLARDFVNRVQKLRKELGFEVTDRIVVKYMTACPRLTTALIEHRGYVMEETLAIEMSEVSQDKDISPQGSSVHLPVAQEIDGKTVIISLTRTQA